MDAKARRYFVSGDVQGVGFRYFVRREVQRTGNIAGFVRNLQDGRVEVYAEGTEADLSALEATLRRGPSGSYVSDVEVVEENPAGRYHEFRITF